MDVETRYVPGDHLLIGDAGRWLLLTDPADEKVVEDLWTALTSSDPVRRVLAVVDGAFPTGVPGLALVAGSARAQQAVRGTGRVEQEGALVRLALADPVPGPSRRLAGGVVSASSVAVPRSVESSDGALIDGVPAAILAAKGPDGPPPPRPRPRRPDTADSTARETTEPDPELVAALAGTPEPAEQDQHEEHGQDEHQDHDGSTVFRPDHLVAATPADTVDAVWCPSGHLTAPTQPLCRICRSQVAPQHPQRVPRPVLGGLRLATGEVVPLDRPVVLGRRPQPLPSVGEWPHLVTVPSEHGFVSRMHLHLSLDGWKVVVRDLGSRGGTTLTAPGQAPVRLAGERPYVLEPGHVLTLADTYEVRYEVGPEVGAETGGRSS
ncbi:FHA domain-containing protein [Nocardioides campestrisoli]|uniref:FHA domain-containing protein n=1 Tax=Nocardioides campestrisoli TaxID=2736757 RepID=UPI00163D6447|nr:FHA domain-containing protein [Nocardioides campestrisoli]